MDNSGSDGMLVSDRPSCASSTLTCGAAVSTVMLSLIVPTCRVTSRRKVAGDDQTLFGKSRLGETRGLDGDGIQAWRQFHKAIEASAPFVVVFLCMPVPVLVAVTVAPATEAPVGSVTVPVMVPTDP